VEYFYFSYPNDKILFFYLEMGFICVQPIHILLPNAMARLLTRYFFEKPRHHQKNCFDALVSFYLFSSLKSEINTDKHEF